MTYKEDRGAGATGGTTGLPGATVSGAGIKSMAYDSQNRIRQVTDAATGKVTGKYRHDDQGFRVHQVSEIYGRR